MNRHAIPVTRRRVLLAGTGAAAALLGPSPGGGTAAADGRPRAADSLQPYASYWFPDSLPSGTPGDGITWRSLAAWTPGSDRDLAFNTATVPLAARFAPVPANTTARTGQARISALAAFDQTAGNPSQGSASADRYAPTHWAYLDELVFWGGSAGEGLILAPNAPVVDAAHRNGVPVLGTVFLPPVAYGGQLRWTRDLVRRDAAGHFPLAAKLVEAATVYGFDGWFRNAETGGGEAELAAEMDTYNCQMAGSEIAHAARNFKDKGVARHSLAPTGWGDGGGGTTREMIAKARRLRDLDGSPTLTWEKPADFFAKAEAEYPQAPVWVGELYLELHRATLTSQAKTKRGNRRSEQLLREAELWSATAAVQAQHPYPYAALDRIWKTVLLHQFHDILPGSSIAWVHREAVRTYAAVAAELEGVIAAALAALARRGGTELVVNSAPHPRGGVPAGTVAPPVAEGTEVSVAPRDDGGFTLDNGLLRIGTDGRGLVVSAYDRTAGREAVAPGSAANLLQLHPDFPTKWDAWDVDAFYRNVVTDLTDADEVVLGAVSPDAVTVRVTRSFGGSRAVQSLTLARGQRRLDIDTEVDWHETEKFLKAAFPLDLHTDRYAAETQFGHLYRPTHTNTSGEAAKFEACAHRFVHLAEPGWGVALVNDATYGHDVTRTVREDGDRGTTTTVRLSLLRAPRFPDPETDQGLHRFRYALVPGAALGDAVRESHRINLPERRITGAAPVAPLVTADNDATVVTAVKLADDTSGDVIVRLHEAHGGRATTTLTTGFEPSGAVTTDLLERPAEGGPELDRRGNTIRMRLRPFQIVTLRLSRAGAR